MIFLKMKTRFYILVASIFLLNSLTANAFGQAQGRCNKSISFATAYGGQLVSQLPDFADKWISANRQKYPGICFSQTPTPGAQNYLLVFSTTLSSYSGIFPTVKIYTSTSTSPVSGSGTVTSNYGEMWYYNYNGTVTTTTTTTTP